MSYMDDICCGNTLRCALISVIEYIMYLKCSTPVFMNTHEIQADL